MNEYYRAKSLATELIAIRRHIHQNPEVGIDLPDTVSYICGKLKEMNIQPMLLGKGIVATIGEGEVAFLLRVDMDALPIIEESGLDFAAKNGCAHACGHDMHIAMLLGAARLLKENETNLNGTVLLMFQPGEEVLKGAKAMIKDGVLEKFKPKAALGVHISSFIPVGQVYYNKESPMMASCHEFRIVITGNATHGSMSSTGVDAVNIGMKIYEAIRKLTLPETTNKENCILTIGQFHGGTACNVLAGQAVLEGTLRSLSSGIGERMLLRMQECAKQIASELGGEATIELLASVPPLECDSGLTTNIINWIEQLPIRGLRTIGGMQAGASEDFAVFAQEIPSTYLFLGARPTDGKPFPNHNPKVIFNEDVLPLGAGLLAYCAAEWLCTNNK